MTFANSGSITVRVGPGTVMTEVIETVEVGAAIVVKSGRAVKVLVVVTMLVVYSVIVWTLATLASTTLVLAGSSPLVTVVDVVVTTIEVVKLVCGNAVSTTMIGGTPPVIVVEPIVVWTCVWVTVSEMGSTSVVVCTGARGSTIVRVMAAAVIVLMLSVVCAGASTVEITGCTGRPSDPKPPVIVWVIGSASTNEVTVVLWGASTITDVTAVSTLPAPSTSPVAVSVTTPGAVMYEVDVCVGRFGFVSVVVTTASDVVPSKMAVIVVVEV